MFDSTAFIDDTLKDASQGVVVQGAFVFTKDVHDDLSLTFRVENFPILLVLDLSYGNVALRAFIQEIQQSSVQCIDFGPPVFNRHAASPFSHSVNAAT